MTAQVLSAGVFSLALATHLSFLWAIRRFFVSTGQTRPGMRAIAGLGTPFALWHLVTLGFAVTDPPSAPGVVAAGVGLFALALVLFWSAVRANSARPLTLAFSPDAPGHLVAWGPYRRVRHPFYASYALAWLGGALAGSHALLLVPFVVMGALYVRAARLEEAKFAQSPLAEAYAAYRARTGMFWPSLRV